MSQNAPNDTYGVLISPALLPGELVGHNNNTNPINTDNLPCFSVKTFSASFSTRREVSFSWWVLLIKLQEELGNDIMTRLSAEDRRRVSVLMCIGQLLQDTVGYRHNLD